MVDHPPRSDIFQRRARCLCSRDITPDDVAKGNKNELKMDEHVRATLLGALGHVFQPMVRLALRNGLSFDDFTYGL